MKLGDAIATISQPIAHAIDAVARTNIAGCNGCKQMQQNLNSGMTLTDAIYQRWFAAKQTGENMKYQMTVVVEAGKMSEVVMKGEELGEVIAVQVRPEVSRPQPTPGQPGTRLQ